jgi:hypothetical protein
MIFSVYPKRNHELKKQKKHLSFYRILITTTEATAKIFPASKSMNNLQAKKLPVSMSSFLNHLAAHRKVVLLQ